MHPLLRIFLLASLLIWTVPYVGSSQKGTPDNFRPDEVWLDNNKDTINAHAGSILYAAGKYYWFGEKRGKRNSEGVNVYSSKDLYHWKYEGLALSPSDDPGSDIVSGCLMERPKVVFNAKTREYVMWFHLELKGRGYAAARAAVAVSKTVKGPYTFIRSFRPNGNMSRDMTLFVDDDGKAYQVYSSNENWDLRIVELTDDYRSPTDRDTLLFSLQREAPAIFKYDSKYYIVTSGCTGWAPNKASLHVSGNIWGPYRMLGNPMSGLQAEKTFLGQPAFVFPLNGKGIHGYT